MQTRTRGEHSATPAERNLISLRSLPAPDVGDGLRRAYAHLATLQARDGHWCGELEGNTILESEYALMMQFLGRGQERSVKRAAERIRRAQEPHGGWSIYPQGPADVSTSVKSYFVLKLLGDDPAAAHMTRARRTILSLGGVEATNSFTRIYLAIFGQYDWDRCPAVPPELALLPTWAYVNLYEMSSWSRVILVPLSVIWATRPRCAVAPEAHIDELYRQRWRAAAPASLRERAWHGAFRALDRGLRAIERLPVRPLRARALDRAEAWMLRRMDATDGFGAIFPPIVYGTIALRCLGYPDDHPRVVQQLEALERLQLDDGETLRVQPCKGPVWDTALALRALAEHRPEGDAWQRKAVGWLVDREIHSLGDWRVKSRARPGGWCFQYENAAYPDVDDTAQILSCLARLPPQAPEIAGRVAGARDRALEWLLSMQNDDGGWGAFDKNCDKRVLTYVPFADHNAMLDPSCADITGRALDALAALGLPPDHPAVHRAVAYLRATQEEDGTWYGRWGCNYIYGTYLALMGLRASRQDMTSSRYQRAAGWLRARQNPDGGWGESLASYEDPGRKGQGESTAAQTAWALLGLLEAGDLSSDSVVRGVEHLLRTQRPDGGWRDGPWTGTGFPRVFYLRYELYDRYFPLLALASFRNRARS